ncbi:hypothetical protein GAY28_24200, partial [Azospirillum brasilense]|nr:hypothetical protein [Azospirillum brasilense]
MGRGGVKRKAPAREAVAPLTRRHAFSLDEHGIARAAIEAAAKGFARKLVAPVFGYALLGVPGLLVWAVVDGADTALGHAGVRHERFGQTAARLDDALNAIPARLAALLLALAAPFAGAKAGGAFRTMMRDGAKAASLNMGWPTAAMAGAPGLAPGGPDRAGGGVLPGPRSGGGRRPATPAGVAGCGRAAGWETARAPPPAVGRRPAARCASPERGWERRGRRAGRAGSCRPPACPSP